MQDKQLLRWFLALNVALAGAFVVYLLLSHHRQPKVVASHFPSAATNRAVNTQLLALAAAKLTNLHLASKTNVTLIAPLPPTNAAVTTPSNAVAVTASVVTTNLVAAATNAPEPKPRFTDQKFNWQQVEAPEYRTYLASLRAVGCPEDKVRTIAMADINELFDQKRAKEAVKYDITWWKATQELVMNNSMQERGRLLEEERRSLIERLLGRETADAEKSEALLWSSVQLTGPVLGSLAVKDHNEVQEICAKSIERHQAAFWGRANEGQPLNQVEMARLRNQTRTDLSKVLNHDAMEEFLLRYSHNAAQLRNELRGLDPTPEEFRKVFRGTDPLDHQVQMEHGGLEALSQAQRERHERQRDAAVKAALSPERYQAYLFTKDPLYRQAQMTATQYGAPTHAILPLYQAAKSTETKRQKILGDQTLTPDQRTAALNAVNLEQQQSVQRIVTESQRTGK